MTWQKILVTIIIFYFFALLQTSFFKYLIFFGEAPNLVFILFFLLVFFSARGQTVLGREVLFYAISAGFFIDIFYYTFIGPSIVSFIIIGFLLKGAQLLLKNANEGRPFFYFLPLFIFFLLVYDALIDFYLRFLDPGKIIAGFGSGIVFSVIYNSLIVSALFFIYKKILKSGIDDRQLTLFSK